MVEPPRHPGGVQIFRLCRLDETRPVEKTAHPPPMEPGCGEERMSVRSSCRSRGVVRFADTGADDDDDDTADGGEASAEGEPAGAEEEEARLRSATLIQSRWRSDREERQLSHLTC